MLEDASVFHNASMDEKGLLFLPLPSGLFAIGQASRFETYDRPAYIQHNFVLDEDAFMEVKANPARALGLLDFCENPKQLSSGVPAFTKLPFRSGPGLPTFAPNIDWESVVASLFSGYAENLLFSSSLPSREKTARKTIASIINVFPLEILSRMPGMHTSAFEHTAQSIAIKFPWKDTGHSGLRIDTVSDSRSRSLLHSAYLGEKLREGMPFSLDPTLSAILRSGGNALSKASAIKDLLSFYFALDKGLSNDAARFLAELANSKQHEKHLSDLAGSATAAFLRLKLNGADLAPALSLAKERCPIVYNMIISNSVDLQKVLEKPASKQKSKSAPAEKPAQPFDLWNEPTSDPRDAWVPSADFKPGAPPSFELRDANNLDDLEAWIVSKTSKDSNIMFTRDFQDRIFSKYNAITQKDSQALKNPREIAEYLQTCPTLKGVLFRNPERLLDIWWECLLWRPYDGLRNADEEQRQKWFDNSRRILTVFSLEGVFMKLHVPSAVAWRIYETFEGVYGKGPDCWGRARPLAKYISCKMPSFWKEVGDRLKAYPREGCRDDFKYGPQIRNFRMAMRKSALVKSLLAFSAVVLVYAIYCTAMLTMSSLEFPWLPQPTPPDNLLEAIMVTQAPTPTVAMTPPPATPTPLPTPTVAPSVSPTEPQGSEKPTDSEAGDEAAGEGTGEASPAPSGASEAPASETPNPKAT
jgi:hypothetical protein